MMGVSALMACTGAARADAEKYSEHLSAGMTRFALDANPRRAAVFLGQVAVESDKLRSVEENLFYTSPDRLRLVYPSLFVKGVYRAEDYVRSPARLSWLRYRGFHGRGLIQLTWEDAYRAASSDLGYDYVSAPGLVAQPMHAALTACWFFAHYKACVAPADRGDVEAVTRLVNGNAMLGLAERKAMTERALRVLMGSGA
jgi:putative chitinase